MNFFTDHVIENVALISINETMFVQIISFLIFAFLANRFIFRPLMGSMNDRDKQVSDTLDSIEAVRGEMNEMAAKLAEYEADAKAKAASLKKDLKKEGKKEALEIVDSVRQEIETVRVDAAKKLEAQILEARTFLAAESQVLSMRIMERLLDRKVS